MPEVINKYFRLARYVWTDSLLGNSLFLIGSIFITSLFGFIFWIVASRMYTPYDVGISSTVISSMNLLVIFGQLGFNISLIKFLPNSDNNNLINSCLIVSLIVTFIISYIFILNLINTPDFNFLKDSFIFILIFIIFSEITMISRLLSTIFISKRVSILVLEKESIFGFLKIPLLPLLIVFGSMGVFLSWGLATIVSVIFGFILLLRIIPEYQFHLKVSKEIITKIFSFSFWNYIAWILNNLPTFLLPLIITLILNPIFTAYFYITWTIGSILFSISIQSSQSLFAEGAINGKNLIKGIKKLTKLLFLLLVPGIIFVLLFGNKILSIFGSEYAQNGLILLNILAISALPNSINMVYTTIKRITGENFHIIVINGIIAIVTIIGSIALLPSMYLIGVGIAWMIGNLLGIIGIALLEAKQIQRFFVINFGVV
jgi:O-antigen/teichoic acid export membrane protein